jgi:hypothetical protein
MEGVVTMTTNVETTGRDAVLVQDAAQIQMMGLPVLEALPARGVPYQRVDPFLLVHESRFRLSELSGLDTRHPHRGFDNLWYILEGSASTGHSTGPDGAIERARLPKGALLALRTGGAPGMPRGSAPRSMRRDWATPSSEACCSG